MNNSRYRNNLNIQPQNFGDLSGFFTNVLQSNGMSMEEFITIPFDIVEEDNFIKLFGFLPGVNLNNLQVDCYNNTLEIRGERLRPYSSSSVKYKEEIIYGAFRKIIELPICVTSNRSVTQSSMENGVFCIIIDKNNEERNRFSLNIINTEENTDENNYNEEINTESNNSEL